MYVPVTERERQNFLAQGSKSFIPGYTGHCPTLRFHFGKCYGTETKEIIQELRDKHVLAQVQRDHYRSNDLKKTVLAPIVKTKGQSKDFALDCRNRAPKYILGYTGFIPTINFRYGKSFGRAADDSVCEFSLRQRKLLEAEEEKNREFRAKSAPKMVGSIRSKDDAERSLQEYEEVRRYREKEISPDHPPIAGYTGHIPRVKSSEESLSKRYNTVVKQGLRKLKEDRERRQELIKAQSTLENIFKEAVGKYTYK